MLCTHCVCLCCTHCVCCKRVCCVHCVCVLCTLFVFVYIVFVCIVVYSPGLAFPKLCDPSADAAPGPSQPSQASSKSISPRSISTSSRGSLGSVSWVWRGLCQCGAGVDVMLGLWNRSPGSWTPATDPALPCPPLSHVLLWLSTGWLGAVVDKRYERSPSDQNNGREEMLAQKHPTVSLVNYYFLLHLLISLVLDKGRE